MDLFHAFLYGAVQGVTEYLPISSSAHLILLPRFLGQEDPGLAFDVFLHVGTLLATLGYFWRDWWAVLKGVPRKEGWTTFQGASLGNLLLATFPALLAGAALHSLVETVFRGNQVLVITLPLFGFLLFWVDRMFPLRRGVGEMRWKDALWVGLFQCLALVPGVSRSGSTMTAGRILGLTRESAARFSFLLSAPITAAAVVFELRKWEELFQGQVGWAALLMAGVSSFVFAWLAIGGLLKLLRRFGYLSFFVYRAGLALVIWRVLGV